MKGSPDRPRWWMFVIVVTVFIAVTIFWAIFAVQWWMQP